MRKISIEDRRVGKTRQALHGALAALIHEKGYEAIAVKEILSRANVGRSTFYTHYQDKNELLESGVHRALGTAVNSGTRRNASGRDDLLHFSLPMLQHIGAYRDANSVSSSIQGHAVVHEYVADAIAGFVATGIGRVGEPLRGMIARQVASAFLLVVNHWMTSPEMVSVETADDWFRALAEPVLKGAATAGDRTW